MKLHHTFPKPSYLDQERHALPLDEVDQAVVDRHDKVAEIIDRHLKEMHQEILRLDHYASNMDNAGDQAEVARQVMTALVDQMRGFSVGNQTEIRQRRRRCVGLPMDLLRDKMGRAFKELSATTPGGGAKESDLVGAVSQDIDPAVQRALAAYALKDLLEELVNGGLRDPEI
jgi:hypothetical protein